MPGDRPVHRLVDDHRPAIVPNHRHGRYDHR
jgi:hypothetical protein